jgi:hypothetical protein
MSYTILALSFSSFRGSPVCVPPCRGTYEVKMIEVKSRDMTAKDPFGVPDLTSSYCKYLTGSDKAAAQGTSKALAQCLAVEKKTRIVQKCSDLCSKEGSELFAPTDQTCVPFCLTGERCSTLLSNLFSNLAEQKIGQRPVLWADPGTLTTLKGRLRSISFDAGLEGQVNELDLVFGNAFGVDPLWSWEKWSQEQVYPQVERNITSVPLRLNREIERKKFFDKVLPDFCSAIKSVDQERRSTLTIKVQGALSVSRADIELIMKGPMVRNAELSIHLASGKVIRLNNFFLNFENLWKRERVRRTLRKRTFNIDAWRPIDITAPSFYAETSKGGREKRERSTS